MIFEFLLYIFERLYCKENYKNWCPMIIFLDIKIYGDIKYHNEICIYFENYI